MAMYVGERITVRAGAVNPITEQVIADATAQVHFFAPGKKPQVRPADRTPDHGPFAMPYHAASTSYVAYVDTDTWTPGKWTARVTLTGVYDSWEYYTFTLKA